jgi:hypothetical protein
MKRMLSSDYRKAIAAEAAGDYKNAARAYALCGERTKVAEMHLLRAEQSTSSEARLTELKAAIGWADANDEEARAMLRRIARALFVWARRAPVLTKEDRKVVEEAAQLFTKAGDESGAGECYEFIGEDLSAAEAYQRGGDVERLEAVLQRDEQRRKQTYRVRDAFEEYQLNLSRGERDLALTSIRVCVDAADEAERETYIVAQRELERKLISDGKVRLKTGGQPILCVALDGAVTIGREMTCHIVLRDSGISRVHAELRLDGEKITLRDLQSKNGTTLGGVRILDSLALPDSGELGFGENCSFQFEAKNGVLNLQTKSGLDRGLRVHVQAMPFDVEKVAELSFVSGRPRLRARGGLLALNGVSCPHPIQLCHEDVVEIGNVRLEVA